MTNTTNSNQTKKQAWSIWKILGLALIVAALFQLVVSFSTAQPEFPLGAFLTLHWGVMWLASEGLAKALKEKPWLTLVNALPGLLGLMVLVLKGLDKLPVPIDLDWGQFLFYAVSLMDSLDPIRKDKQDD